MDDVLKKMSNNVVSMNDTYWSTQRVCMRRVALNFWNDQATLGQFVYLRYKSVYSMFSHNSFSPFQFLLLSPILTLVTSL